MTEDKAHTNLSGLVQVDELDETRKKEPRRHEQLTFNDFLLPQKSTISADKISQMLPEMVPANQSPDAPDEVKEGRVIGITTTIGKKDTITITAALEFAKTIAETDRDINIEEQEITDAIIDLYLQGFKVITPSQIFLQWRLFTNEEKRTRKVTQAEQQEVIEKVDKLRQIMVKLNLTELAKARGYNDTSGYIEDHWLNLRKFKFVQQGKKTKDNETGEYEIVAYQILTEPVIRQYQEALGSPNRLKELAENKAAADAETAPKVAENLQVITVSKDLLSIPDKNKTAARVTISRYLAMRIELIKNQNNNYKQNIIKLDTIIEKTNAAAKLTRRGIIDTVTEHLEHFKKKKYIHKYEINRGAKNKVISFTVYPNYKYTDS